MANIRITCPACKSELEIGAEFEGQEVECGSCLKVFRATRPGTAGSSGPGKIPGAGTGPSASGRDRSPSGSVDLPRSRGRREDYDDDYQDRRRRDDYDADDYPGAPRYRRSGEGDGAAVASLILGIISVLVCCCPLISVPVGLSAAITGGLGLKSHNNKGLAVAGLILGIAGMGMAAVVFLSQLGNRFN